VILWRRRTELNLVRFLWMIPDRLKEARWQRRCRCTGRKQFEQLCVQDRPVILAVLHFGPLLVLRYWLRAHGWAAAFLSDLLLSCGDYVQRLSDQATGLGAIPHTFDVKRLKPVYQFLRPSRILIIAVDGAHGRHCEVAADDWSLRMAPGALRLAARTNAIMVPCLVGAERPLRLSIHFGDPVPDDWVADPTRHPAACVHLLREFLPLLRAQPEQCHFVLLSQMRPRVPQTQMAIAELSGICHEPTAWHRA
jgi:lauroyl/myristoyl acyltransferase